MKKKQQHISVRISPVAEYPSRKDWEDATWMEIIRHLSRLRSGTAIARFLENILTATERKNVLMRAAALHRIGLGKSYREIGQELWLIPQTISAIKKAGREHSYRSYHERGKTERMKKRYSIVKRDPPKHRVRTKYGTIELSS